MKVKKVISSVEDPKMMGRGLKGGYNISNSPIWKDCYHPTDKLPNKKLFVYTIKFDGLKPVQCTKGEIY
jgi:hypothetical protein